MKRLQFGMLALALGALAGCSKPFVYEEATEAEREAYFDSLSQGIYDGLDKTLPHGKGGVYMRMGERKVNVAQRRIEIVVEVQHDEEDMPDFSGLTSAKMLGGMCPDYLDGDMVSNKVKVHVRFELQGGGTVAAVTATPETCARFAEKA